MKRIASVAVVVMAAACGSKHGGGAPSATVSPKPHYNAKDLPPGLELRLSEGKQGAPSYDHAKVAPAQQLAASAVAALLARAKPLTVEPADQQAFALRPASQPPPRTGQTISSTFPAPASSLLPPPAVNASKQLSVLRYMPEGKVPLAPELSVTFDQPMVAVTSQGDASGTQPVKLTPQPKGKWRWLGTRTVLFDPEVRFPQATTYRVEIPAGTKSASGAVLGKSVSFSFETPPPSLIGHAPYDSVPQKLDVPMFVELDQKIDPQAVLRSIKVSAIGRPALPIRLMTDAEIEKDHTISELVAAAKADGKDGRWVAFRTEQPLAKATTFTVELAAGTPSAEGPNPTREPQSFSFFTYAPLAIDEAQCNWGGECRPGAPFTIRFNNPLDEDKLDDAQVTITPAIPGLAVEQSGTTLTLAGMTSARTKYHVVVSGKIADTFGQTLGKDASYDFTTGDAYPTFYGPSGLVVVDPAGKQPSLDFFSTNYDQLKVQLYKVAPADYHAFARYVRESWNHDHPPRIPGTKVLDTKIATTKGKNQLVETALDLAPALGASGAGHAIAIVEPYPWKESYPAPRLVAWAQATKLGVDVHVDADQLVAYVSDLATGKPAADVDVELQPGDVHGKTGADGMVRLELPAPPATAPDGESYLVARRGDDMAFVPESNGYWQDYASWSKQPRAVNLAWYVIDDRKMYRPGEEVSLKGWLRAIDGKKGGDVGWTPGAVKSLTYKVTDAQGVQIGEGKADVDAVGGFSTKLTLPKTPNLGTAYVNFVTETGTLGGAYNHPFEIQEFRRPEFEVSAHASQGPFTVGDAGDVTVDAKYYAGGALGGADVSWYVTASRTSFTPPNRDDYQFGDASGYWGFGSIDEDQGTLRQKEWSLAGKTDASGSHVLHFDFVSVEPAVPMSVSASASVMDVNRQAWNASAVFTVHPSSLYVGVKAKRPFVEKGQPFDVELVAVDLDGKAVPGAPIDVKAVRLAWEYKKGRYRTKEVDPQTCHAVATKDPSPCTFHTNEGGQYKLTATVVDDRGRPNTTTTTFWVSGGEEPPAREVEQELVRVIPDKKTYSPGNTAELLLQAPFYPAEGIVTWRRSGIVKTERITFDGPTKIITVPIDDAMTPNLFVQVDLVGSAPRLDDHGQADPKLPRRPAYAVGSVDLSVPPKQRTLAVTVTPAVAKLAPGKGTTLALEVHDAAGRPVADAQTAVIVVDESILALAAYDWPDPTGVFYQERGSDARDAYLRAYLKLAKPDLTVSFSGATGAARPDVMMPAPSNHAARYERDDSPVAKEKSKPADLRVMDRAIDQTTAYKVPVGTPATGSAPTPSGPAIAVRSNFNPLAAFAPAVKTDAAGKATVEIKVPDNLTRYRIVAVAVAGDKQFGKGESAVTARLPVMVRPSPPRFLNFGDTFRLPVVVQNQTDSPMQVQIAVRATNATLTDGAGRMLTVPANDRLEVQFPMAAEMAGTARLQVVTSAGDFSDAAELSLPVWTPATTEAFATYGVIDDGAIAQPVALPGKVVTQFGGLEVTTASTNLQALTDALLYLVHYPFECAEQRSSRVLAIAALRDVLTSFKTKEMPTATEMERSVAVDIEHLSQMQNYDGGFAFWDRGYPSEPYLSVFVVNALAHAKAKGFAVPQQIIDQARPYLRDIESHYPWYYSREVRWAISAYALYTRKAIGDLDIAKGKALYREAGLDKMTMETAGWLLGLFARNAGAADERAAILRHALNHVSETAGAANFTTSYGDGAYLLLASDRRVDGVMLESLIEEKPELDLIPKLVTGLLAHRKAGRWGNTQENAFVLLALDLYFHTYEKVTPDFVARVWLGNDAAGDHAFKGRTTEYAQIAIPMKDVATHDKQNLTIQKDGAGRLYYRIGMTYAPADLKLPAADYGFVVQREYEGADDPKDVTRDAQGTWHIRAGSRVRVKLSMVNENRRYHVALVDPIPAGLEAMNPALAVTGPIPTDPNEQKSRGAYWWWYGPWYEHQNMRDERVEAFASLLWEGVHRYEYVARATTPGNFVVPPPKAEEMYAPETFGRGASDRVIVE